MEVLRNGKFSLPLLGLNQGLRKVQNNKKNSHDLLVADGVFVNDGMLESLETITRLATTEITDAFPYPQIFVETNLIIICGEKTIYEYDSSTETLSLKHTVSSAASTWTLVSFHDYVYLSNGNVSVVRDAETKEWSETTDIPTAMAVCNYNGQVIIGAPDAGYE